VLARVFRSIAAVVLAGAAALATGCDSGSKPPKRLAVVRQICDDSWVPTARTFIGYPNWRRTSVRIGPVTLMGAKTAAAHRDVAAYGNIKFRTLVRPLTAVTVEIAPAARSAVGFVAPADALRELWPKHGAAILRLAPCRVDFPPPHSAVGYPMFLRVRHNACVGLTVTETRSGRSARGTVSIGAGRCGS
jgi:hypothetical protein